MSPSLLCMHTLVFVTIIISCSTATGYYRILNQRDLSRSESQQQCHSYKTYLASIASDRHNDEIMGFCNDICWIGLTVTKYDADSMHTEWSDGIYADPHFIEKYLCDDVSYLSTNMSYYAYLNSSTNCWDVTTNASSEFYAICGPKIFDDTNYYWISKTVMPCIVSFIGFCYTLYCNIYVSRHLYFKDHNWSKQWQEPSRHVKSTATLLMTLSNIMCILYFIHGLMLYIGYRETNIFPPSHPLDDYYPSIYTWTGWITVITALCYFLYVPIGYIHVCNLFQIMLDHTSQLSNLLIFQVFLRLRRSTFENDRCINVSIIILLILFAIIPPAYGLINSQLAGGSIFVVGLKISLIILEITVDITINVLLRHSYVKALKNWMQEHFRFDVALLSQQKGNELLNCKEHELVLEATRYTVLFTIMLIFNIIGIMIGIGCYVFIYTLKSEYDDNKEPSTAVAIETSAYIANNLLLFVFATKDLLLFLTIQLGFAFSHSMYLRICTKCHNYAKNHYDKQVWKKNQQIIAMYPINEGYLQLSGHQAKSDGDELLNSISGRE